MSGPTPSEEQILQSIKKRFDEGSAQTFGNLVLLVLVNLDSGARLGIDQSGRWHLITDKDEVVGYQPQAALSFLEPLEIPRREFEERLEQRLSSEALPVELGWSYPAVAIIKAALRHGETYTSRLALQWVLPSEARDIQEEIALVLASTLPTSLKDYARLLKR